MPHELQPRVKLAPAEYRRCPQCHTPMLLKAIVPVRTGLKARKFECRKCRQAEEIITPVGIVGRLRLALEGWSRPFSRESGAVSDRGPTTRPTPPAS